MIITLTGATGLVGNALCKELHRRGHHVIAVVRDASTAAERLPFCREIVEWRLGRPVPAHALDGAEGFIHLAGENIAEQRWTSARKRDLRDSRIETLRQLISGRRQPFTFSMTASAVGYYGDRGAEILTESSPPGTGFLSELCVDWEEAGRSVPSNRHLILRLGVVLAPEGGFLKKVAPVFKRVGASRLGRGEQYFSWIHIHDLVDILASAVDDESMCGVYNLTAPNPVTNAEMTAALAKALDAWKAPAVPAFALRLLYGEMAEVFLHSQRVLPARLLTAGWKFIYPDFTSALDQIFCRR